MKKLIAWAFFALVGSTVFAQAPGACLPAPQVQGQPQRCWDGRIVPAQNMITGSQTWNPYNGVVGQQQYGQQIIQQGIPVQYAQPQYVSPQYYQGGIPGGNGLSNCTLVGAIAGGTLGSLAHHHTGQAVILGALAGGVAGSWMCNNNQGQRVMVVPQQQYQQQVVTQSQYGNDNNYPGIIIGRHVVNSGGATRCRISSGANGEEIRKVINVVTPEDCKVVGELVDEAKQQVTKTSRNRTLSEDSTEEKPALPSGGCGVTLAGFLIKSLPERDGSSCEADKKLFIAKFKAQCWGKGGSDAADRTCGARLTLD